MTETKSKKLLILYATQTGNAMDVAERIGREAERRGCPASLLSVDEYDASLLPLEDIVVFVVSTTGQGDPPDSMKFVAKKLDKRLSDLGAQAIVERGLGDDQHPSGYEGALDPWLSSLWRMLHQMNPESFPDGSDYVKSDKTILDLPKVQIRHHAADEVNLQYSVGSGLSCTEIEIEKARCMSPGRFSGRQTRPDCFLKLVKNHCLTKAGCGKDVRHLEFNFESSVRCLNIPFKEF
ncbi:hypothetical protein BT93_J0985 [Corymbia citriodora subsp. variegata]|nr:hypothetical protein BT93_J0985 [Corymbia citriodora subsp. variegata]